jgi:hypothetical protein
MNLDRHRESLVKYSYDISKVTFAIAVLNPLMIKGLVVFEVLLGLGATFGFLGLALLLEKDIKT